MLRIRTETPIQPTLAVWHMVETIQEETLLTAYHKLIKEGKHTITVTNQIDDDTPQ